MRYPEDHPGENNSYLSRYQLHDTRQIRTEHLCYAYIGVFSMIVYSIVSLYRSISSHKNEIDVICRFVPSGKV